MNTRRGLLISITPFVALVFAMAGCVTEVDTEGSDVDGKADVFGESSACAIDTGESGACVDQTVCDGAGGVRYAGFCPDDPVNIQCCILPSCEDTGGRCMEGCEPGYVPQVALHNGCFDSVCCVASTTPTCDDLGGECMEGCEPGTMPASEPTQGCFDSVCCVASTTSTCGDLGGECMEGCEPGTMPASEPTQGCFDSACCVPITVTPSAGEIVVDGSPFSCADTGGECMEGCEPGYMLQDTPHSACFDSVCCIASTTPTCHDLGGECMEGCEPSYWPASLATRGCVDSACCVPGA